MIDACPKCQRPKNDAGVVVAAVMTRPQMVGDRLASNMAAPVAVPCCHPFHNKPGFDRLAYHPNR
jgi:hypothetical protein